VKQRVIFFYTFFGFYLVSEAFAEHKALPPPPPPPQFMHTQPYLAENEVSPDTLELNQTDTIELPDDEMSNVLEDNSLESLANNQPSNNTNATKTKQLEKTEQSEQTPEDNIPHGENLVSIDFPNGVLLSDIIKTVGVWSGKNFVLTQGIASNAKISIIAPQAMTKEEAYQAFLSALNISGFTTVETGKVIKILPIPTAKSTNLKTYYGANWAPETDEIINQVIPLRFIDANVVMNQLRPILGLTGSVAFTTTNSLILTDTGFRIKSLLEIIELLDNRKDQPQVEIIPINHMDAKDANQKIGEIFGSKSGTSINLEKSLVDERTNSLILIGPARGLDDVVKFIKRLDSPVAEANGQAAIHVRPLDYADAEKLAQTLQAFSQSQSRQPQSPYFPQRYGPNQQQNQKNNQSVVADLSDVKIASDKSTNSLIIQGSQSSYLEMDKLIQSLDRRKNQVYLEADILDLNIDNGLTWQPSVLGGSTANGKVLMPYGFNPTNASIFSIPQSGSSQDFQKSLAMGVGANLLLGILSNTEVDLGGFKVKPGGLLFALKTDANTNVLSTPSMMVADNETAKFNATAAYRTLIYVPNPNGTGNVPSPQNYDVTTALEVTPQVSRADYINLKIHLELDDAGPVDIESGYPNPIQKRSADSVVTIRAGQTIVMGGLTKESNKRSEKKVPLLGDIPILGWLFKQVSNEKIKSNLTLFLTPHVVRNSEDLARIYKKKLEDRDDFLKLYYGKRYKKESFYKNLRQEEDGAAQPETQSDKQLSASQIAIHPRKQALPSENKDPITAPANSTRGTVSSFSTTPQSSGQQDSSVHARSRSSQQNSNNGVVPPPPAPNRTPQ